MTEKEKYYITRLDGKRFTNGNKNGAIYYLGVSRQFSNNYLCISVFVIIYPSGGEIHYHHSDHTLEEVLGNIKKGFWKLQD